MGSIEGGASSEKGFRGFPSYATWNAAQVSNLLNQPVTQEVKRAVVQPGQIIGREGNPGNDLDFLQRVIYAMANNLNGTATIEGVGTFSGSESAIHSQVKEALKNASPSYLSQLASKLDGIGKRVNIIAQ